MNELLLIPDQGWQLATNKKPEFCFKCSKLLELPFMFCKEYGQTYCNKCERANARICLSREDEHIHYNIILSSIVGGIKL